MLLFPSLFSLDEVVKKKKTREKEKDLHAISCSSHLKEEALVHGSIFKKSSNTHEERSEEEDEARLSSSSSSLDCLCDLYERQRRLREKDQQGETRGIVAKEARKYKTHEKEEEDTEEKKGRLFLLNQVKRGFIKLEEVSHSFSSSLIQHLGVYTLPVLFLSSGVFGSFVAFFTFKRRMKFLSSMPTPPPPEHPHLLFSRSQTRAHEKPSTNSLSSSSSSSSSSLSSSSLSSLSSSSSSSSSFSILAEEMKKNRRKRANPCESMFDDEEEEFKNQRGNKERQGNASSSSSPSSSSCSSVEGLEFHEIAKLFLLPASSLFLLFASVWIFLKHACQFRQVGDFLETLRWLRGTGPAPLPLNSSSSSSSSLQDQRKKSFLRATSDTSSS